MSTFFKISLSACSFGLAIGLPAGILLNKKSTNPVTTDNLDLIPSVSQKKNLSSNFITSDLTKSSKAERVISKGISTPKKQLEKLKERADNPDLCKKILNYGEGYLRVCKESINSSKVEFEYYPSQYSMPIPINNLSFNSSELIVSFEDSNFQTIRMDLTQDMIAGKGLFSSHVNGKPFTDKNCSLKEFKDAESQIKEGD